MCIHSDFWSLGCVLYELRRGLPPFGHHFNVEPALLLERIRTAAPVAAPVVFLENTGGQERGGSQQNHHLNNATSGRRDSNHSSHSSKDRDIKVDTFNSSGAFSGAPAISEPLADLLEWLLEKAPLGRCDWPGLLQHPFWGNGSHSDGHRAPPKALPPQPYFERYVAEKERARRALVEAEVSGLGGEVQQQAGQAGAQLLLPTSDSTPAKSGRDADHRSKAERFTAGRKTEDIRRLREVHQPEDLHSIHTALSDASSANDYSEVFEIDEDASSLAARMSQTRRAAGAPSSPYADPSVAKTAAPTASRTSHRRVVSTITPVSTDTADQDAGSYIDAKARAITSALGEASAVTELEALVEADLSARALLMHASDGQVKPIVGNKAIEAIEKPPYKASGMPFNAIPPEEVGALSPAELETFVQQLYKSLYRYSIDSKGAQGSPAITMNSNAIAERSKVLTYICNISSSADVANIVLNSQFLSLLLRIIKTGPTGSVPSPASGLGQAAKAAAAGTGAAYVSQSIVASRVLAATSLALMLRFATFIQPPKAKSKDEHIVQVLAGILKDASSKVDVKLKRRVVAALGETVFYVSAQDDSGADASNGSIGSHSAKDSQWSLPGGVISALVRCLKDETDEVVRHYACKTIENVLAQGNLEYRRRFCLVDVGVRLLELSQHSRNEALQASCAMALAHMFYLVMTSDPSGGRGDAPIMSGARFITKVFEKGGLPGLVDTLRDGQFKQQQAYLNIVNIVFCPELSSSRAASPLTSPARGSTAASNAAQILLPLQQYFLRTSAMVPTLLRLVENGGSLALRAKALLSVQLMCRHRHAVLTEHRLPTILMRLIDPYIAQSEVVTATSVVPSSYNVKVALSTIFYIRSSCVQTLQEMGVQLERLCSHQHKASSGAPKTASPQGRKPSTPSSPDKHSTPEKSRTAVRTPSTMVRQTPPSEISRRRVAGGAAAATPTRQGSAGSAIPQSDAGPDTPLHAGGDAISAPLRSLSALASALRSSTSVASLPILGRLVLGTGPALTALLAAVLRLLPLAREHLLESASASLLSRVERDVVDESLGVVEQAALFALETVAQIDIMELLCGSAGNGSWPQSICKYVPDKESSYGFVKALVEHLLPAAGELSLHADGDVRVLVAASLRRLVPAALRAMQLTDLGSSAAGCLRPYLECVVDLLADQPPIPQYTLRLLADAFKVSPEMAQLLTDELRRNGALGVLTGRLKLLVLQAEQLETDGTLSQSQFYDENSVCYNDLLKLIDPEAAARKKEKDRK